MSRRFGPTLVVTTFPVAVSRRLTVPLAFRVQTAP